LAFGANVVVTVTGTVEPLGVCAVVVTVAMSCEGTESVWPDHWIDHVLVVASQVATPAMLLVCALAVPEISTVAVAPATMPAVIKWARRRAVLAYMGDRTPSVDDRGRSHQSLLVTTRKSAGGDRVALVTNLSVPNCLHN